jgi:hypothetical protein
MAKSASEIIDQEIKPYAKIGDWEEPQPGEEHYSPNQVIAAYEAGKTSAMNSLQRLVQDQFETNKSKAGADTRKLIEKLMERGFHPISARLKITSWDFLEVLITVPEEEYCAESFDDIYDFVNELERASRSEQYCISFRFCPTVEGFDENKVKSDGFIQLHKSLIK